MKGRQVTQSIIDDVIVDGQVQILMRLLLMLLGIGFGRAICGYIKEFIFDLPAGVCVSEETLGRCSSVISKAWEWIISTGPIREN